MRPSGGFTFTSINDEGSSHTLLLVAERLSPSVVCFDEERSRERLMAEELATLRLSDQLSQIESFVNTRLLRSSLVTWFESCRSKKAREERVRQSLERTSLLGPLKAGPSPLGSVLG